jgi:signal transduction histidine kinase
MRYRLRRHDGKYRWILDTGVPRYSPDGTFMGFIGSCIDIQEMVEAHEALENLNAALEKANLELAQRNEELDSFAHIASHDLKEPIRGIAHLLNFLREDCGPQLGPAGHGLLDRMDAVVERMQRLLDALLDYASVGRAEAEAQRVDLGAVVDRALEPLQSRILEWGVEVRIPRPLPTVRCAPIRAEQVFANLLSNALKYGPEQGAVIEIGWAESDPSASEARIPGGPVLYVRDNGIGIPENQHENIFRVFKRLHPRDSYGGGAGVGLSIVRKIVDVSGGHLRVESAPGHGATFWFTFGGQTS